MPKQGVDGCGPWPGLSEDDLASSEDSRPAAADQWRLLLILLPDWHAPYPIFLKAIEEPRAHEQTMDHPSMLLAAECAKRRANGAERRMGRRFPLCEPALGGGRVKVQPIRVVQGGRKTIA
jgi:hypothetical protein